MAYDNPIARWTRQKVSDLEVEVFKGEEAPLCGECVGTDKARKRSIGVGRLRPRIVLYNEDNPDQDAIGAVTVADLKSRPDAVIVVGTSLKIPGVKRIVREMCKVTRGCKGGFTACINAARPPPSDLNRHFDLVGKGDSDHFANEFARCKINLTPSDTPSQPPHAVGDWFEMIKGIDSDAEPENEVVSHVTNITSAGESAGHSIMID